MSTDKRIQLLEDSLRELAEFGTVYRKPSDWDYPGMGGGPTLEDCEEIDLTKLIYDVLETK